MFDAFCLVNFGQRNRGFIAGVDGHVLECIYFDAVGLS